MVVLILNHEVGVAQFDYSGAAGRPEALLYIRVMCDQSFHGGLAAPVLCNCNTSQY